MFHNRSWCGAWKKQNGLWKTPAPRRGLRIRFLLRYLQHLNNIGKDKRLSTLHVDLGDQWRGGQQQALGLMLGLRARGHMAELVALGGSPLERRAQAQGLRVHAAGGVAPRLQAVFTLKKLLGQGRFELVHSHDAHGLTAAWIAGASGRARHVASRRVAYPLSQNRLALSRYRRVDRIIAVSCFVKKSVVASGLPPDHVDVIYDGVELPRLPSEDERLQARRRWSRAGRGSGPLLGCVGYLLPEKGQEHLVRALPMIAKRHPNARLILAGDGPCRDSPGKPGPRPARGFSGGVCWICGKR